MGGYGIISIRIKKDTEMALFIVHGVVQGQEVSKCDEIAKQFCDIYYNGAKGVRSDIRRTVDNRMAYSLLFYEEPNKPFISYSGRTGSYFGMTVFFPDKQVTNPDDLFRILLQTYNNYVKGKFIQELPSGARKWMVKTIDDPSDSVATYVGQGLQQILDENPGILKFQSLAPLQKPGRVY